MLFKPVDKIPLWADDARESTLKRWHNEGLPKDVHWFDYILDTLGIPIQPSKELPDHHVNTKMIPTFEEKVLRHENGHYIVQDWMGAITEISDEYDVTYIRNPVDFVTRKWHKFPVTTPEDWREMKKRYDPDAPERYPANTPQLGTLMADRDTVSGFTISGPFWQLREWLGFENLCLAFIDQPEFVADMVDFWCAFGIKMIERTTSQIPIDSLYLTEDMAYKAHPMISPAMTREYLLPVYRKWVQAARKNGVQLITMDSDGYVDDLIPIWIEAGINVNCPVEVAAHNDITLYRKKYGTAIAYTGDIDKRAIAAGGKIMEMEVQRVVQPFLAGGGLIPGCDHGVPSDVSLQNYMDYTRLRAQLTGWK